MIETPRLRLIPCEPRHFEAILAADRGRLGRMLGVAVPDDGLDFSGTASTETIRSLHEQLKADPAVLGWWMHLFVHAEDEVLVGQGGYKGRPDEAGRVEIGYAIVPAYRRRGLATEVARGLIDNAFAHAHVKRVEARTLAERNASTRVLERVGMGIAGTANDPELGEVWRWSLQRADFRPG